MLRDLAHSSGKTVQDLLREMRFGHHSCLRDKASQFAARRLEHRRERLKDYEERLRRWEEELSLNALESLLQGETWEEIADQIARDRIRQQLEEKVLSLRAQPEELGKEDIEQALEEYIKQGYLDLEGDQIKITPRGARKLAHQVLRKILEKLQSRELGPHSLKETGFGAEVSRRSRKLELGDEYYMVDVEQTLLNSLKRNPRAREGISLEVEDFEVREPIHQTRVCSGLIIDESGSMQGEKLRAAIDASLALSELIRREPKDVLKVFLFSDQVRKVNHWDILNVSFSGGTTDIRAALRAFRKAVRNEKGDKQAYLITDTEPNTQDGRYVGFEVAAGGVLEEAWHYRREGITLNIIMLSQSPNLKLLARKLAQRSLGRVFFTTPQNLGEMVIEDYLQTKKKLVRT